MIVKVISGKHQGLFGRAIGTLEGLIVLQIQTRDQWLFIYVRSNDIAPMKHWSVSFSNGSSYIHEEQL